MRIRLALAQMNPTVGEIAENTHQIIDTITAGRRHGANIVVFPELAITGYPPEDLVLRDDFVTANLEALTRITKASEAIVVVVGHIDRQNQQLFNAATVCAGGHRVGTYHKICLPNYGVFDERRYFVPGATPLVLDWQGLKLGINICEDIWTEAPVSECEAAHGAQLIINISASPYHFRKGLEREQLVTGIAKRCSSYFAYVNMVGGQDELVFDGQAFLIDPSGQVLLRSEQFVEQLLLADVEFTSRPSPGAGLAGHQYRVKNLSIPIPLVPPQDFPAPPVLAAPQPELDEVLSALVLGTRDYVRKNGFTSVVLGLSGGIDSAVVAAIAVMALGKENVVGVSMPSRFTADISINDARELAENLGIRLITLPIENLIHTYDQTLVTALAGKPRDTTEENIQARIRGNLLMALSNKFGWMVLSTSNKSETAVGYTTLYGDMVGGFAVIKDVPKTLVFALARWINERVAPRVVIPPRTIERPPTAELRPDQADQDSLPPYEVLDRIIEGYVEDDHSVAELTAMGLPHKIVIDAIKLIDRAEYKRHQGPPGVKITTKNFGKDRRMPITNRFKPYL